MSAINLMKRLWNSSLVTKFFLSYLAVVALLFVGFYYSSNTLLRNFYIGSLSDRMEQEAHLLAPRGPVRSAGVTLDTICRQLAGELGSRITVIAPDGRVLGDSAEVSGADGKPRQPSRGDRGLAHRNRTRDPLQH